MQRRIPKNEKHEIEVEIETQQRKQDNEQQASYAKEYVAKAEAELQKICDDFLALMNKNRIPSARRIAGAEGRSRNHSSLSKSILNRSQRSDRICDVAKNTQHNVPWKSNRKLVMKSMEIQVEEKQVAERKNKVRIVKNSLEVTNSSIKLTPR